MIIKQVCKDDDTIVSQYLSEGFVITNSAIVDGKVVYTLVLQEESQNGQLLIG